ncbi:hypothetical protein IFM89_025010 [Coptis chinensis]|uniref:RNase H type-1 domain-containing protein n=1 Tax=Coptis chinensis TaxID=261450 RepID=A0A835HY86_9MAGN|nr:hypothetical protein IFM89_025010 [Coptis chinensis]
MVMILSTIYSYNALLHGLFGCNNNYMPWFGASLWWIWKCRNENRFDGSQLDTRRTLRSINALVSNVLNWTTDSTNQFHSRTLLLVFWSFPWNRWTKINTDGFSFGNPGPSRAGCLFRRDDGYFICAGSVPIPYATSLLAETFAIRIALRLASQLRIPLIVVEKDSSFLCDLLNHQNSQIPWEIKEIVEDI